MNDENDKINWDSGTAISREIKNHVVKGAISACCEVWQLQDFCNSGYGKARNHRNYKRNNLPLKVLLKDYIVTERTKYAEHQKCAKMTDGFSDCVIKILHGVFDGNGIYGKLKGFADRFAIVGAGGGAAFSGTLRA